MFFWHTIWGIPGALLASIATGKKNPARNPNSKDWGFIHWMDEQVQKKEGTGKPEPPKPNYAIGSVQWQEKSAKKRAADLAVGAAEDKIAAERAAAAEEDKERGPTRSCRSRRGSVTPPVAHSIFSAHLIYLTSLLARYSNLRATTGVRILLPPV